MVSLELESRQRPENSVMLAPTTFPTLAERPDAYVLIFDGQCRFCRANVRWIAAIDQGRIAYVSLHDPIVAERWPELTHEELMSQMYLIDDQGRKHPGAAAFRFLSRHLVGLWILSPFLHIPGSLPVWQFFYKRIARLRYRFGRLDACDDDACELHFK